MAAELRWILAGLGVLLIAGIWWWGARHSRQAPGSAELRETTAGTVPASARAPAAGGAIEETGTTVHPDSRPNESAPRDWGVPPFEPLTIRTARFDELPPMDPPMSSRAEPLVDPIPGEPAAAAPEPLAPPPSSPRSPAPSPKLWSPKSQPLSPQSQEPRPEQSQPLSAQSQRSQSPQAGEMRHIVSIRVCAPLDAQWAGVDLLAALENHGMAYGRYNVFHRRHSDGRTQFSAASLVEPGTFSLASMPHEEFRGVTLFAVLPGPVEPLQTLDALIATAGALAQTLDGSLQDSAGLPLTIQRAEALREEVAGFQSQLAMIAPSDPR